MGCRIWFIRFITLGYFPLDQLTPSMLVFILVKKTEYDRCSVFVELHADNKQNLKERISFHKLFHCMMKPFAGEGQTAASPSI